MDVMIHEQGGCQWESKLDESIKPCSGASKHGIVVCFVVAC